MKIPKQLIIKFLENNFEVKQTQDEKEVRINSTTGNDTKFHVYINIEKSVFTDYKDNNYSGGMDFFIADFLDIPLSEVFTYLIKEYGLQSQYNIIETIQKEEEKITTIEDFMKKEKIVWFRETEKIGSFGKIALKYIQDRKIENKYIEQMGYIFDGNSYYDKRLIIPFFEDEKLIYFLARDVTGKSKMRYNNPPKIDCKNFVFNIDKIEKEVVIFEGVIDAMSLTNQIGTAMLSADLSIKQINKLLAKGVEKIIYVPDNDYTGLTKIDKNINNLFYHYAGSINLKVFIYSVPKPFKDYNELKVKTGKDFIDYSECEIYNKFKLKEPYAPVKNIEF